MKKYTPYDIDSDEFLSQVHLHDMTKGCLELIEKNYPDSKDLIAEEWVKVEQKLQEIDIKFKELKDNSQLSSIKIVEFLDDKKLKESGGVDVFCDELKALVEENSKAEALKIGEYHKEFVEFFKPFVFELNIKLREINK